MKVQDRIVLCTMRQLVVKSTNKSGRSLEYFDKDETMVAHLAGGVDAVIKVSQGWPISNSPLKLISLKSSHHYTKGIPSSFLSKVKGLPPQKEFVPESLRTTRAESGGKYSDKWLMLEVEEMARLGGRSNLAIVKLSAAKSSQMVLGQMNQDKTTFGKGLKLTVLISIIFVTRG
ncbi:hypothetical protein TIFTF001_032012 [Ficus carica]|uniref:Uncharacterized protein n=1 Tax=Ficus carica TaxID=3494 RepID=A0AA88J549_FICCA|nr:hypothetical protein TIFTF001_032012 [Ficus carica]